MIVVGIHIRGEELYGKIQRLDGTCVATTFKHVWAFPIWPLGSYVLDEKSPERGIAIGNHVRSIVVGYVRCWGIVWLLVMAAAINTGADSIFVPGLSPWALAAMFFAAVVSSYTWLAWISRTHAEQRRVYAKLTSIPVDVAWFSKVQREELWETVRPILENEGRALGALYRDGPDPVIEWRVLARDPKVQSKPYLEAALTWARAEGDRAAHDAIWKRLS